jgi:hypothetical protein
MTCFLRIPCAYSQESDAANRMIREDAVKVFLDIHRRYHDYVKTEITFVNYVRDRKQAQVHILMTTQRTGSNGREFTFTFMGQEDFEGMNDTLTYVSRQMDTREIIRFGIVRVIKQGLVRYVARTPMAEQLSINFMREIDPTSVEDRWNNWVFSTGLEIDFRGEEATSMIGFEGYVTADRVTPEWKISLSAESEYDEDNYDVGDRVITSISRSNRVRANIVKSLGEHWSTGLNLSFNSSTYSNTKTSFSLAPGLEYNIFPYSESTRKEFRIIYRLGYENMQYFEKTIYDKTRESLFGESLSSTFEMKEKWGSVSTTLGGSHYFHDISKSELYLFSWLSIRLFEGFSVTLRGKFSMVHNQLSLPKEEATEEEILLHQKQLETQYNYSLSVGFRFTFGSIYSNVVNPRFGN